MVVNILEIRITTDESGEPDGYHVEFEIGNGQGIFLWRIAGIPLGTTKQQAMAYIQNNFDEIYANAVANGEVAPDLIDNPHLDMRRLVKAEIQVMVDSINTLRSLAGLNEITYQQAYNALRTRYIELE